MISTCIKTAKVAFDFDTQKVIGFARSLPGYGTGTKEDPYRIRTLTDLATMNTAPGAWSSYWELCDNVDATDTINWNNGLGWQGVGSEVIHFSGHFNGNGHVISNLYQHRTTGVTYAMGFFGFVGLGATVCNFGLKDVNITATDVRYASGLAGENDGTINRCWVTGGALTGATAGGLCAYNLHNGIINKCYVRNVSITTCGGGTGGFVGINAGYIYKCFAEGDANTQIYDNDSTDYFLGGFCGENYGTIGYCYSTVKVVSYCTEVGGFCGEHYAGGIISNCFSTGSVTGRGVVGGFVGWINGAAAIENCYSTGFVTADWDFSGFCAVNDAGTITNCFWNTETSGQATSDGGTGKTTAEMILQSPTFSSWNFTTIWYEVLFSSEDFSSITENFETTDAAFETTDVDIIGDIITIDSGILDDILEGSIIAFSTTDTLPEPLVAGTKYYVIKVDSTHIQVSITYGGEIIDITSTGIGTHTLVSNIITVASEMCTGSIITFSTTGTLPAPLVAGTKYYAIKIDPTHIQVSATSGGTAIALTTAGVGTHTLEDTIIDIATEKIITEKDIPTGTLIKFTILSEGGGLPAPLADGTIYYAIRSDSTHIKLATTLARAIAGTAINITTVGTGTSEMEAMSFPRIRFFQFLAMVLSF